MTIPRTPPTAARADRCCRPGQREEGEEDGRTTAATAHEWTLKHGAEAKGLVCTGYPYIQLAGIPDMEARVQEVCRPGVEAGRAALSLH